jgi:signal transduction histidine kinase
MANLRTVQVVTDACAGVIARIEMGAALQSMADERGLALAREQRAHAAAAAANRAKDEFLATLSHEMRTPLNAILGWVQTLQKTGVSGERLIHGLAAIERSANDQRRLVDDLLDMSRIVSGKFRLDIAVANLRTIIDDALIAIGPAAEAKRLVIETDIDGDMVIRADSPRLQQVLWNLLSNAVKFTPPAGVITIAARRARESISIQVTDTGVGIEPELLPYVFDRFRQGDGSPTRFHGGLGLGLSIVRTIAELHGGTVVAASPGRNQGATITMTLPVSMAQDETAAAVDSAEGATWLSRTSATRS